MQKPTTILRRRERKMLVERAELSWIRSLVRLHPAAFCVAYPARVVNNIYFDTLNFDCFREGIDGLSQRCKTRMRWYGDLAGIVEPVIQQKRRDNLDSFKDEYLLAQILIGSEVEWKETLAQIIRAPNPLSKQIQLGLAPTLINQYKRDYLVSACERFRLTIDYGLKYFDQNASSRINITRSVPSQAYLIIELKYDPAHDTIAHDILNWFPFRMTRSSKYKTGLLGGLPH